MSENFMKGNMIPEFELRDDMLQIMIDSEWVDMYITTWVYPSIKIGWEIIEVNEWWIKKLTSEMTENFAKSLISEKQHEKLLNKKNLDFSFSFWDRRFRCNVSFQLWKYMVIIRLLTIDIPDIDTLDLPDIYKEVTKKWQWLILVTWPTWSGKTTTLASMVDYINTNAKKHIITVEDPIEYVHKHKSSIIEHKEIWKDVMDYETALMWAMRQRPDVIMFWEMRTKAEMEMALRLSETWHLVLSTIHTRSAYQTITRIIDAFDASSKNQIRLQLADSLIAIFSQRLLKWLDWTSIKLAKEILVRNHAVANLIRENELHQIPSVMQTWGREGMMLLEEDLINLIKMWYITEEEWLKYSNNPKFIKENL